MAIGARPARGSRTVFAAGATCAGSIAATRVGGNGAVWALWWMQSPAEERSYRLSVLPPAGYRMRFGLDQGGRAISPDGRTLAFVAEKDGDRRSG